MLCCCARDPSTSYTVEDTGKSSQGQEVVAKPIQSAKQPQQQQAPTAGGDAKIITGKGALSTSNQTRAAVGEANLDKSTVSATKREKTAVTEQPISSQARETTSTQPQEENPKGISEVDPSAASQPKSVSVISVTKAAASSVSESGSIEKAIESSVSAKAVEAAPALPTHTPNSNLESLNSSFDKIEKELSEAESKKSAWEAGAFVPGLANQVKVLTSQVLAQSRAAPGMADIGSAVARLEAVATRLEALAVGKSLDAGDSDEVSPFVLAYDAILSGKFATYLSLSNDIGGDVKTQAAIVKDAFDAQRAFLVVASKSKQPDQAGLADVLKPMAAKLQAVQELREKNRRSEYFNHLSALSESIPALGWVTVTPAPGPFVKEMADAGTFYTNRVLKDFKEKDARHVEWTRAWIGTLTELQTYIKDFHRTGVAWNPKVGLTLSSLLLIPPSRSVLMSGSDGHCLPLARLAQVDTPDLTTPASRPSPPPPPPPVMAGSGADDNSRSALFAELSKGEKVTQGLRKVTDDMKTHKNPALRQGPAPFKSTQPKPASPKPAPKPAAQPAKPPVTELQGKKWVVEYHKGNQNIVIDQTELKQSLYIFKCEGCVVQVKGKINSIILDSCKKTAIVFDSLLASLEFVNCQSMQAQVNGKLPTVSIDKTDGCMVYLSKESLDVEIVSAKSSEMNILVPQGDGDYKEFALPEQFKTKYDGKSMVTECAESL
ncbi:hypothetical protein EGW08_003358 [Elysia chlorotica]|uniref:C-CAP/cofactor C-like domain-containing protein n=1 Tax=Elysia chlorotica TaxID=188477 RepID=A0A3S1HYW9_ELYCH|nr:hypothetical protein EGW08_003358 [Elysia chlorotica]